jgi:hypothetical protein
VDDGAPVLAHGRVPGWRGGCCNPREMISGEMVSWQGCAARPQVWIRLARRAGLPCLSSDGSHASG